MKIGTPAKSSTRLDAFQAACACAIADVVIHSAGDPLHSSSLLKIIDDYIPGVSDVWILSEDADPTQLRSSTQSSTASAPHDISKLSESLEVTRFPIPGRPAEILLGLAAPPSHDEKVYGEQLANVIGIILELRDGLARRARGLQDDFKLLAAATQEITRCQSIGDLIEVIAREGEKLLVQRNHSLFSLQRYSPFNEEITCVALIGKNTARLRGLRLTTSLKKLRTTYYPRYEDGRIARELPRQESLSFTGALLREGAEFQLIGDVEQLESDQPYYCLSASTRSELAVPIVLRDGNRWGVLNVESPQPNAFSELFDLPLLRAYARIIAVFIQALERGGQAYTLDDIISLPEELKKAIRLFAQSDESVLISGETGTGKELVARALHYTGVRKKQPFIPVNCGAIEPNLMMSELFGYRAFAYTGAGAKDKVGLFQAAHQGTIFLDEIENMPIAVQEAVLRVVEHGEIRKVGETATESVDVRVLAACNVDLAERIRKGLFRQDLFYRLKILEILLPPLRERREFIPDLLRTFIDELRKPMQEVRLDPALVEVLMRYHWPGNIRELKNLVKRMLVFSSDLTVALLPEEIRRATRWGVASGQQGRIVEESPQSGPGTDDGLSWMKKSALHQKLDPKTNLGIVGAMETPDEERRDPNTEHLWLRLHFDLTARGVLEQVERTVLQEALTLFQGDRYRVASFLGLSPPSIYRKIKRYGIQEERRYR